MPATQALQILMTSLWTLLSVAFAAVFLVKYKASATGVLGALGSSGHAVISVTYAVVPILLSHGDGPHRIMMVFNVLNSMNWLAGLCVLVAIILAPVPRREPSTFAPQAWTPPPAQ